MLLEVAHQMALVPIIALMILGLLGKRLPRSYWLLGLAFAVSWVGDSLAFFLDGAWWGTYFWLPFQFWLVLSAFLEEPLSRVFSLGALIFVSGLSWAVSSPSPDMVLTVTASVLVLILAHGRMAPALRIYFGLGTVAYLAMITASEGNAEFTCYAYQSCRALAYTVFLAVVLLTSLRPWRPSRVVISN